MGNKAGRPSAACPRGPSSASFVTPSSLYEGHEALAVEKRAAAATRVDEEGFSCMQVSVENEDALDAASDVALDVHERSGSFWAGCDGLTVLADDDDATTADLESSCSSGSDATPVTEGGSLPAASEMGEGVEVAVPGSLPRVHFSSAAPPRAEYPCVQSVVDRADAWLFDAHITAVIFPEAHIGSPPASPTAEEPPPSPRAATVTCVVYSGGVLLERVAYHVVAAPTAGLVPCVSATTRGRASQEPVKMVRGPRLSVVTSERFLSL